ncbi:MAG: antibiotic biosynthesis monooxygenase family protein [Sedimenticolaceae bacterium]|jgi:quinol monooxygenase YgiN
MINKIELIVLIEVQPGKSDEQINLYKRIRPLVLEEAGCLEYELRRVAGSDEKFVLSECWVSEEALAAHNESPHMKEADSVSPSFRARSATVLELSEVEV